MIQLDSRSLNIYRFSLNNIGFFSLLDFKEFFNQKNYNLILLPLFTLNFDGLDSDQQSAGISNQNSLYRVLHRPSLWPLKTPDFTILDFLNS